MKKEVLFITTINIKHLIKNKRSIDSFINSKYENLKKKNTLINKVKKDSLFVFNINKKELNLTGKIFILKQFNTPKWVNDINLISQKKIKLKNYQFKCSLLIKVKNHYFALSYNHGDVLLKNNVIDDKFGNKLSRNLLSNEKLKSLEKFYPITNVPIKKATKVFGDDHIPVFEDDELFLVDLIKGKANLGNYKNITISGSDSIKISGKVSLNKDLVHILNIFTDKLNEYLTENHFHNEIIRVTDSKKIKKLNNDLKNKLNTIKNLFDKNKKLNKGSFKNLKFIDTYNTDNMSYTIPNITIDNNNKFKDISLIEHWERIISTLNKNSDVELIDYIKTLHLKKFIDSDFVKIDKLIKYLFFLKREKDRYYLFMKGNWYSINRSLTQEIITNIDNIERFNDVNNFFPDYKISAYTTENDYNKKVYEKNKNSLILLDKKNFFPKDSTTNYNKRGGIEICDLLEESINRINLFCVKRDVSGSGFSHLIGQALATAKYISDDDNQIIKEIQRNNNSTFHNIKNKKKCIVLVLISNKNPNKSNREIFTILSMINLYYLHNFCNKHGIDLKILFKNEY